MRRVGGRVYLELLTNSCKLGDINYSYINIVGLIGLGISNLLIGLTIFAVKEIEINVLFWDKKFFEISEVSKCSLLTEHDLRGTGRQRCHAGAFYIRSGYWL